MSQENDNKDSIFLDGEGDSQVLVEQSDTDDIINTMDISAVPKDKPMENKPMENKPMENKPMENKPMGDKPMGDKPTEDKSVDDKPVEDKLMEDKSVDDKPVEDKSVALVNIKVKTLSKLEYTYSYDVNKTVGEFKEHISSMMPEHPTPGLMKLILSGKVLKDEEKIEGLQIDDSKFLVMMITKPKPKPSPATTVAPASTSTPTPTHASLVAPPVEPLVTAPPVTTDVATTDVASTSSSTANNLETHPMAQMIPMFIAMLVKLAESPELYLQTIQNNPEILRQIVNDPNMRNTLLNVPGMREGLLRSNPEIAQLMQVQPEQFSAFISHPDFMSVGVNMLNRAQSEMGGLPMGNYNDGMTGGNDDVMDQQMAESVGLTPENMNDINDIMSMGFSTPKSEVIQFYIACDKNKEMTISMILGG